MSEERKEVKKMNIPEAFELIAKQIEEIALYLTEDELRSVNQRVKQLYEKFGNGEEATKEAKFAEAMKDALSGLITNSKVLYSKIRKRFMSFREALQDRISNYAHNRKLKKKAKLHRKLENLENEE